MFIDLIVGARPNFIKIAPIIEAIKEEQNQCTDIQYRLIHTGQHNDKRMSSDFFQQLHIPEPDINLHAKGNTHAELTSQIIIKYEQVLQLKRPDLALVVGDVTSTMACAITAKKMNNIPLAHVEAGIRSDDLTMPEEINRIVTDSITDFFFTTSHTANQNLIKAGATADNIHFVGNTMIDTLLRHMPRFQKPEIWDKLSLQPQKYVVMTLHRPSNVDNPQRLKQIIETVCAAMQEVPVIFPVHPRTRMNLDKININCSNLFLTEPLGYLEFNYLAKHAKAMITDSGGIPEETTVMNVPCMTLRDTTERPETCTIGTNLLLGTNPNAIFDAAEKLFSGKWQIGGIPELWDGQTSKRIISILKREFCNKASAVLN